MQKNKLIKNTFLLVLGGLITKILGFIIKILYTRYLKDDGVSLITLVFPTYSLLLTISNFFITRDFRIIKEKAKFYLTLFGLQ